MCSTWHWHYHDELTWYQNCRDGSTWYQNYRDRLTWYPKHYNGSTWHPDCHDRSTCYPNYHDGTTLYPNYRDELTWHFNCGNGPHVGMALGLLLQVNMALKVSWQVSISSALLWRVNMVSKLCWWVNVASKLSNWCVNIGQLHPVTYQYWSIIPFDLSITVIWIGRAFDQLTESTIWPRLSWSWFVSMANQKGPIWWQFCHPMSKQNLTRFHHSNWFNPDAKHQKLTFLGFNNFILTWPTHQKEARFKIIWK